MQRIYYYYKPDADSTQYRKQTTIYLPTQVHVTPGSSSLVHALLRSVVLRLATNNLHHDCLDAYRNVRG